MACIVYQTNKKTNTVYAYRSESYRDPVTKKPKSRRVYLGRVDPETKEIIPKAEEGKRNRAPIDSFVSDNYVPNDIAALKEKVAGMQNEITALRQELNTYKNLISSIRTSINAID